MRTTMHPSSAYGPLLSSLRRPQGPVRAREGRSRSGSMIFCLLSIAWFGITCTTPSGHLGVSNGIEEAKERGVMVGEYALPQSPYKINDTMSFSISNAWIERRWAYGSDNSETIVLDGFQLIIETSESELKNYYSTWTIGVGGEAYFRPCGKTCILTDMDYVPGDTLYWKVQMGRVLHPDLQKTVIGVLRLAPIRENDRRVAS